MYPIINNILGTQASDNAFQNFIDPYISRIPIKDELIRYSFVFIIVAILVFITKALYYFLLAKFSARVVKTVKQDVFNKCINADFQFFVDNKVPIIAIGHKSIIMLHALSKWIENPSMQEIFQFKDKKREALIQLALFNRNISGLHGLGSISMAHTHDNVVRIQEAVEEIALPVSQSKFN